jgi:hypothetical protein
VEFPDGTKMLGYSYAFDVIDGVDDAKILTGSTSLLDDGRKVGEKMRPTASNIGMAGRSKTPLPTRSTPCFLVREKR